jgi:hypothetical protein
MPTQITGLTITNGEIKIDYKPDTRHYAEGVNWWPTDYGSKVINMYTCSFHQGQACSTVLVDKILASGTNSLAFITNLEVWNDPANWSVGKTTSPNTCGQTQTDLSHTTDELLLLHNSGICMRIVLGSWCSRFPSYWLLKQENSLSKWLNSIIDSSNIKPDDDILKDPANFSDGAKKFVTQFESINNSHGNVFDGIDFDWEGFCPGPALWNNATCSWGPNCSGDGRTTDGNSQTLGTGKGLCQDSYNPDTRGWCKKGICNVNLQNCWTMIDQTTVSIMIAISHAMRDAGYVVTAAPTSTQLFSSKVETSQNKQNQYVLYGKDYIADCFDGVMLQWYSGFDAGICSTDQSSYPRIPGKDAGLCKMNNESIMPGYSNLMNKSPSNCPRSIDCPDWKYTDSDKYKEQIDIISSMAELGFDISKQIVIGFEFFRKQGQWGPQPLPLEWMGLNNTCKTKFNGKDLAGYGGWTLSGSIRNQGLNYTGSDSLGWTPSEHTNDTTLPYSSYIYFRETLNTCWGPLGTFKGTFQKSINALTKPTNNCTNNPNDFYKTAVTYTTFTEAILDIGAGATKVKNDYDALEYIQQSKCGYQGS